MYIGEFALNMFHSCLGYDGESFVEKRTAQKRENIGGWRLLFLNYLKLFSDFLESGNGEV